MVRLCGKQEAPLTVCQRGHIGLVTRTHVLEKAIWGNYMSTVRIDTLTVRELGDIAAERGVTATSLLAGKHPHIIWPEHDYR